MTDTAPQTATDQPPSSGANPPEKQEESFIVFLVKLVAIVAIFRSFFFSPFNIPSESMLPRLENGDYLLAAKWPYGFSSYSLPFSLPLIPGRILPGQPARGDVVIFKAPPTDEVDYIKRVIGLPGDTVQMKGGVLHLNGVAVPMQRLPDFEIPVTANTRCYLPVFAVTKADGSLVCRYPMFRETLPGDNGPGEAAKPGKVHNVLDLGTTPQDDTQPVLVPEGMLFLMGDNRDNSMDSRFPAVPNEGIGLVPQANLVGRATILMWSTNGGVVWYKPWTWITATRWSRIGGTF